MYTITARNAAGDVIGAVGATFDMVTIGRAVDCTIQLASTSISRRHAAIRIQPDGTAVISDEGSANGVRVDGAVISGPTKINEKSAITIGDFTLSLSQAVVTDKVKQAAWADVSGLDEDTLQEPSQSSGQLQLVGRGGPYDGTIRVLDRPLFTIGRVEGNDLVLVDPSISRRHAQIRMAADGQSFTVVDLRSSNGSYVDGRRIKRAECRAGTILRLGDLPFKVIQKLGSPPPKKRTSSKKRILITFSILVAVASGLGTWSYLTSPKPQPKVHVSGDQKMREIQAEVQRLVDEGRRHIAMKEWSKAIQILGDAQQKDPLNRSCKALRQGAIEELSNEKIFEKGLEFFNLGNRENLAKAKDVFLTLPKSSIYFRDVRYKLSTINERLASDYRIEGVTRCKANYWSQCQQALCTFFELIPEDAVVPGETNLRSMLQQAEKRLARSTKFKGCQSKRFLTGEKSTQPGEDPSQLLAEKYELLPLREVTMLYYEGKMDLAIKRLNVLINKREMRPYIVELREVDRQLLIIRGKYQEGYTAFRDRKVKQAHEDWEHVLEADAALMPKKMESFFRREVTRYLGDLYFDQGDEQYKAGRYVAAFSMWIKGREVDPRNEKILNGLLSLEQDAERLLREGKKLLAEQNNHDARKQFTIAKEIVQEGHMIKKAAEEALKELGSTNP